MRKKQVEKLKKPVVCLPTGTKTIVVGGGGGGGNKRRLIKGLWHESTVKKEGKKKAQYNYEGNGRRVDQFFFFKLSVAFRPHERP